MAGDTFLVLASGSKRAGIVDVDWGTSGRGWGLVRKYTILISAREVIFADGIRSTKWLGI